MVSDGRMPVKACNAARRASAFTVGCERGGGTNFGTIGCTSKMDVPDGS